MRAMTAFVLLFACAASGLMAQTPSPAAVQIQRAQASVAQFSRTHSIARLDAALRSLEAAGGERLHAKDRASVLAGYVSLFGAIDREMPRLPAGKVPAVGVSPPRVKGVRYPPGIAPSVIPDPVARARYERDIRDNEAFAERFLFAAQVQRLDDRAVMLFGSFAHDEFSSSDADKAALKHQIETSSLSRARRERLLKSAGLA